MSEKLCSHKLFIVRRFPCLAWHQEALAALSARVHDDELGDKRDCSHAVGEMEHEEQNKQASCVRACWFQTDGPGSAEEG